MSKQFTNSDIINQSMFVNLTDEQFKQLWVDFKKHQFGPGVADNCLLDKYLKQAQSQWGPAFFPTFCLNLALYACARLDNML